MMSGATVAILDPKGLYNLAEKQTLMPVETSDVLCAKYVQRLHTRQNSNSL